MQKGISKEIGTFKLKRLLLPLLAALALPTAVNADLGAADRKDFNNVSFSISCGDRNNPCTVSFDRERLRVNGGKGITAGQVLSIHKENLGGLRAFTIEYSVVYEAKDGKKSIGKFFSKESLNRCDKRCKARRNFEFQLKAFTGREFGPNMPIDVQNIKE